MGEYYEQKPFKIHTKRKQGNYGQFLDVINQNNENVKRKKSNESTNNDSWKKQKKQKQQLNIQGKEKSICEQKMAGNN